MAIFKTKLKGRQEIATGTMAFFFEKPAGFSYKAGQAGDFTLENPPETDAEGNTRAFSFASAPYEGDLMVATRMRDTALQARSQDDDARDGSFAGRALWFAHAPQ
jgi:ferredoxin-NADP reductase